GARPGAGWKQRRFAMLKRVLIAAPMMALGIAPLAAHHGWGSYDAKNPVTVAGKITTSKFENPHVTITVQGADKAWTVTLAPMSRMISRGAVQKLVSVGNSVSAYGYPSTR